MKTGNKHGRYTLLVSLGAKVLVPEYFPKIREFAEEKNCLVECCLLDVPEIANLKHLTEVDTEEVDELVERQVDRMKSVISHNFPRSEITRWSDYAMNEDFVKILQAFEIEYNSNASFQNHCHNQTFSNLQPILKTKGIRSKRHRTVADLSSYLIRELSLMVFLENQDELQGFLAPKKQMEIKVALDSGKYPALSGLTQKSRPTIVVE